MVIVQRAAKIPMVDVLQPFYKGSNHNESNLRTKSQRLRWRNQIILVIMVTVNRIAPAATNNLQVLSVPSSRTSRASSTVINTQLEAAHEKRTKTRLSSCSLGDIHKHPI